MIRRRQGRGADRPAALGLLGLVCLFAGVLMLAVVVVAQVPDPPRAVEGSPGSTTTSAHGSHQGRDAVLSEPAPSGKDRPTGAAPRADGSRTTATADEPPADDPPSTDGRRGASPESAPTAPGLRASEPVTVRVPELDVDSPLHALGLAADGSLQVPSGTLVDQAAWYSGSPTPGETGPSVIEGHVTGPGGRPSVFFELAALASGDRVEVDRADGGTVVFEVYRVQAHPKDEFPTVAVYGPTAEPELRLITCGGDVDPTTGHHVDNTVVFARMVDADLP